MRWAFGALIAFVIACVVFANWSERAGRERAYLLPLTLVSERTEVVYTPITVTVMAGNTPMPITTMTPITTHYVITNQGEYINDLQTPAPFAAGCARIEPRPGMGRYITAFTTEPCPEATQ